MSMLNYLINFSEEDIPEVIEDLDISDRLILQSQINETRKAHIKLIRMYDEIKGKRLECSKRIANIKRDIYTNYDNRTTRSDIIATNQELIDLNDTIEAYDTALETIKNHIEFLKSDIRILTNSMYNRN